MLGFGWNDLTPLDTVLNQTRQRAQNRRNETVDRIADLGIEYQEQHPQLPDGGYVATKMKDRKGNPLALATSAVKTACKLLDTRASFFKGFEDRNAFPKSLVNKLDNVNREKKDFSYLIRTGLADDGLSEVISAILPGSYEIRDAHEQLANFAGMLTENIGPVRGVMVEEQGFGDVVSYRMIVGENIMTGTREDVGQFMAFCFRMSENGLIDDKVVLGLYRLICKNGAMGFDTANIARWSHKTPVSDYMNKAGSAIHATSHLTQFWGKIFNDMAQTDLKYPAPDYLHSMRSRKMISDSHFKTAEIHASSGMEPGKTHYDLFNLLTRGAQDLPEIKQRQSAEQQTLKLFTSDRAVEQIEEARSISEQKPSADKPEWEGAPGHEFRQHTFAKEIQQLMN